MNNNINTPSDFQEMFRSFDSENAGLKYHQKPRKKRTKFIRIDNSSSTTGGVTKPKYGKKPDHPGAPNTTPPCSECGKKFWSWKALFGHMRCHPERQWRGINPPPNTRRPAALSLESNADHLEARMTEEDHLVATCLIMLANGPSPNSDTPTSVTITNIGNQGLSDSGDMDGAGAGPSGLNCRFECSSCKKVFGSHQALGGHRATHKNVKGCFAITRNEEGEEEEYRIDDRNCEGEVKDNGDEIHKTVMLLGHKCSICLRVFSSGQALGGHKRCHWEKGDEPSSLTQGLTPFRTNEVCRLDLNLPAPLEDDHSSSSYSLGLALDLRLAL